MTEVSTWNETDANNNSAAPAGAPEGMAANGLNDTMRAYQGAASRWHNRASPVLTSTGTSGHYILTTANASFPAAYTQGMIVAAKAHQDSAGGDDFAVNSLGGKPIYKPGSGGMTAIAAADIKNGQQILLSYDSALNAAAGGFQLLSTPVLAAQVANLTRSTKTGAYPVAASDKGTLIEATSGTWTLSFGAAATLGNGFWFFFKNSGTGEITLDPNASETIDGVTSFKAYSNEARIIYCDGSNFFSTVLNPLAIDVTATKTLTIPPGYSHFRGLLWGAGGGGFSGAAAPAGGGAGGGCVPFDFTAAQFGTAGNTIVATIAAGGTPGNVGGNSTLGALVSAYGGAGATGPNGTGGGGAIGAGSGSTGGGPLGSAVTADNSGFGGAGGGNNTPTAAGNSAYGGGGGGSSSTTTAGAAGASVYGGGGGGAAGSGTASTGGASIMGGNGGAGAVSGTATTGSQPGGGGGGARNGTAGSGGAGSLRLIGVV